LAKICGYKVLASCSSKTEAVCLPARDSYQAIADRNQLLKSYHVDATLDYKKTEDEQLEIVKSVTGGNFGRVFDAVAQAGACAIKALQQCSTAEMKYFTTVDDW
jgi:hypothetical protein